MNSLFRILLYGIQGFRRNIWLSIIAIITMTLTITTITVFALGNVVATKKYQEFNNRIDYNIFIQDSASDADVNVLKSQIPLRPEVAQMTYISKDDALKLFESNFKNEPTFNGVITADNNPLPREIDVRFKDPSEITSFDQFVRQPRFAQVIEDTSYRKNSDEISSYIRLTNFFKIFGISFTSFFVLIAVLVILNTVRLAIYSRREEVEIMRLVGATRSYIRGPFLMEGILFGLLGALISGVLTWVFLRQLQILLQQSFQTQTSNFISDLFSTTLSGITISSNFNTLFNQLLALQVAVGVLLGVFCSAIAVRRYLKEN